MNESVFENNQAVEAQQVQQQVSQQEPQQVSQQIPQQMPQQAQQQIQQQVQQQVQPQMSQQAPQQVQPQMSQQAPQQVQQQAPQYEYQQNPYQPQAQYHWQAADQNGQTNQYAGQPNNYTEQTNAWQNPRVVGPTSGWQNAGGAGTWQTERQATQTGTWQIERQTTQTGTWQEEGSSGQTNTWQTGTWQTAEPYQQERSANTKSERKEKKTSGGLGVGKAIAIALCCSLLGGIIGAGSMVLGGNYLKSGETPANSTTFYQGERPNTVINVADIDTSKVLTPAEVYAINVNSTVGITTSITTNFWGYQTTSAASGSGFILSEDGYVITNYHVIENSNTITVTTYDGTAFDAELLGYDANNDIAVLKIEAEGLTPVVLGDSSQINVGDGVVAIGNPLGELTFSMASGYISALDRSVTFSTGTTMNLLQLDCAINSGNSGGPLFNMYGEVIGITNAKYSNNGNSGEASIENIGFAIPISSVRSIFESIIEKGYITKPQIGVGINNVSAELQAYGVPQGAMILSVTEDGPAAKGGVLVNDIITKVNDTEITSYSDLQEYVGKTKAGDELVLTIYRQGQTIQLTVIVEEVRVSAFANEEKQQQQQEQQQQQNGGFPFPWGFDFGF